MNEKDYRQVNDEMRLSNGIFWPLPVHLPLPDSVSLEVGSPLCLRDIYGNLVGLLHVDEIYESQSCSDSDSLAETEIKADNKSHHLQPKGSLRNVSGKLEVIRTPPHFDFVPLRHTPESLRAEFEKRGWERILAFPDQCPLHRAEVEMSVRTATHFDAGLLIQPKVGVTKPGDVDHYTRIRCFRAMVESAYQPDSAILSLLPLIADQNGVREALLLAIVRRNYGCTHLMTVAHQWNGQTDAPEDVVLGTDQFETFQRLCEKEIGITPVKVDSLGYAPDLNQFLTEAEIPAGKALIRLTEREVRENYLLKGQPVPDWFTDPSVAAILQETCPPRSRQGLTIWFTGLSGSGKSTVAHGLVERLAEFGRNVAFLDGDEIRTHLSKGLGFSKDDRDTNINRVGYVAGLVAAQGGTTICSVISPYRSTRDKAREASKGNFVEIFCDTPLAVCETRDVKGLYAKARAAVASGKGLGFTGIDDAYERPLNPEVTLDTSKSDVNSCVDTIINKLKELGYLRD
jgi:sulfate adenylyltransferase